MPVNIGKNFIGLPRGGAPVSDVIRGGAIQVAECHYEFGVDAATGTVPLTTGALPVGAIVVGGFLNVTTALTGTGNAALQVQAANDIVSAITIAGAPWSTISRTAIIPVWTFASWVQVATTAKVPSAVFTGTLTAGVFDLYLFYVEL